MSSRLLPFAVILSLAAGVFCFFLFRGALPADSALFASGEGWAVLAVDESRDDRLVRESLERGGIPGLISESSQEIPVNDFGSLRMIALDSFREEIETFDPRDTGFADKLKSFFVRDGKRFFFFPLDKASGFTAVKLEKQFARILGGLPFTFTVLGLKTGSLWYFALLAAACAGALCLSRAKRLFLYSLPVLLAFGWFFSFSFIFTALLAGIGELLREPLEELSASRRHERGAFDYAGAGFRGFRERFKPFRVNGALALLFTLLIAGLTVAGEFPPFPVAAGCGCFFLLRFAVFRAETARAKKSRHIRFTPVPLLPFRGRTFSLFPLLLPFAAAASLALVLPLFFPAFTGSREKDPRFDSRYLVSSADYERYLAFQRSFSLQPLGPASGADALNHDAYLRYYLGEDGLIAGGAEAPVIDGPETASRETVSPPFPLEKLMRFLIDYSSSVPEGKPGSPGFLPRVPGPVSGWTPPKIPGGIEEASGTGGGLLSRLQKKEWIPVVIILTISALNVLRSGTPNKRKKVPFLGDKRIAA